MQGTRGNAVVEPSGKIPEKEQQLPLAPKTWKRIELGSPIGNDLCTPLIAELQERVVNYFMAPDDGKDLHGGPVVRSFVARVCVRAWIY